MHQNIQYTNKHLLYARTLNGIYQKFMTKVHNKHLKSKETKREQIPEKVIYIVDNILATSEQHLVFLSEETPVSYDYTCSTKLITAYIL